LEELDQKKVSATLKSHDEILDLFKKIETIEKNINNPEIIEDASIQPDIGIQDETQIKNKEEIEKDLQKLDGSGKKKKPKEPKIKKHFLKLRKSKLDEITDAESTELQDQLCKTGKKPKLKGSTFTLKRDNQGNLVGLNIKKPRPKKEKKSLSITLFKKGEGKKEATPVETEVKGIKGIPVKIKGVISKMTSKIPGDGKGESSGLKTSGVSGKIKGIFSKK
jgi:hypothetical protein